jgi:hypothetical protein
MNINATVLSINNVHFTRLSSNINMYEMNVKNNITKC